VSSAIRLETSRPAAARRTELSHSAEARSAGGGDIDWRASVMVASICRRFTEASGRPPSLQSSLLSDRRSRAFDSVWTELGDDLHKKILPIAAPKRRNHLTRFSTRHASRATCSQGWLFNAIGGRWSDAADGAQGSRWKTSGSRTIAAV
jgi:hypothetical protein